MRQGSLFFLVLLFFVLAPLPAAAVDPAPSVLVLSKGEPLLAGSVEAFVEQRLAARGFDVVDESGIPGLQAWLEGRVTREEETRVLDALAQRASHLVMVEAGYLGDRPLYYLHRVEPIFQARLKIRALPFEVDAIPTLLFDGRIEFTHLSLERVIADTLGGQMKNIAAEIAGRPAPGK